MSRRITEKEHIRSIQLSNGSYLVALPIYYIREFKWRERRTAVAIRKVGKKRLLIEDAD